MSSAEGIKYAPPTERLRPPVAYKEIVVGQASIIEARRRKNHPRQTDIQLPKPPKKHGEITPPQKRNKHGEHRLLGKKRSRKRLPD